MEVRKPSIKAFPYDEWKDNDTLEKMANDLNDGGVNLVLGNLDQLINWGRSNSLWSLTFATSCCGIEFMAVGCARYDFSRFGFEVTRNSPRQADLIMCAGTITNKMAPAIRRVNTSKSIQFTYVARGIIPRRSKSNRALEACIITSTIKSYFNHFHSTTSKTKRHRVHRTSSAICNHLINSCYTCINSIIDFLRLANGNLVRMCEIVCHLVG